MYNLKVEAFNIVKNLRSKNYNAYLIGNYPFVKYNNSIHPDEKLKIKQFSIITDAKLDQLQKMFTIKEINDSKYNKYALIEVLLKSNLVYYKIYYATTYFNFVNNTEMNISTIDDILNQFNFLIDTVRIDANNNMIDYNYKKISALNSIELKQIIINGNLREKIKINPLIIMDLFFKYSNINYELNNSLLKIISNNYDYLKYVPIENIIKYFNDILLSDYPSKGLKLIKQLINLDIFNFLKEIPDEHINEMDKFDESIDIISRWSFLLKDLKEDKYLQIIDNYKLSYKNKIVWLIQHFDILAEDNYKMAIYNTKESLKSISEEKWNIFLLFDMFDKLTKMNVLLFPESVEKCKNIIECIYSRPFFEYQLKYSDKELIKIANIEKGAWLDIAKTKLVLKILMCDMHPNAEEYLQLTKEAIEYGLLNSL